MSIQIIFLFLVIFALLISFYYIIYRKMVKKELKLGKVIINFAFFGYVLFLFKLLLIDKTSTTEIGAINLGILSTYKEALYYESIDLWKSIILKILMFIPVGVLIPLTSRNVKTSIKNIISVVIGIVLAFIIEVFQHINGIEAFQIDDILNGIIGTVIGLCCINIIQIIINKEKTNKKREIIYNIIPIIVIIILFSVLIIKYKTRDLGYLWITSFTPSINMENIQIVNDIDNLSSEKETASIYKAKTYTKEETEKIASEFFAKNETEIDYSRIEEYDGTIHYYSTDDFFSCSIDYIGGSYRFYRIFRL